MKPVYIEIDNLSVVAICGTTGSGKSSTARFLVTQFVLDRSEVIICDPHGMVGTDSLSGALEPLHAFMTVAVTKDEIIAQFRRLNKLFERRKNGEKGNRIVLFLDETPAFFLSCNREEMREIGILLTNITNQARKVNIRVFLLGQNWKADYIGAKAIRASINTIIFHRITESETRLFIESAPAELRRKIANLNQGEVFLYGMGIESTILRVPYIGLDDIKGIARTIAPESYVQHQSATLESQNAHLHDEVESAEKPINNIVARLHVEEIIKAIKSGEKKEDTIIRIFKTYKSSRNKKWIAASKLYDALKEKL